MASPAVNITLLVPGMGRDESLPALQWSDAQALQPWQSQFCKQLAQEQWNGRHLPVAELLIGARCDDDHETGGKVQGVWICADPVHLRADRDTARLVPAAMLSLTDSEADALLASINEFLADDDVQLSRTDACHWYMKGMDGHALLTFPPEFLAQRNASAFLPEGEATGHWKRLMTELQMLLHSHPVNTERERRGLMPINSLWFWGGAPLIAGTGSADDHYAASSASLTTEPPPVDSVEPGTTPSELPTETLTRRIHADEAFAVALAAHLGLECLPLSEFDPASVASDILIVDRRLEQAMLARDEAGVQQARQRTLDWVDGWQQQLQRGASVTLTILDEDGMQGRLDAQVLRQMKQAGTDTTAGPDSALMQAARSLRKRVMAFWGRLTGRRS